MKTPNPEHIERLKGVINSAPYFRLLSMRISEIGMGYSIAEIDLADKHLNPFGGVHGGVFATIIDSAASWAMFYGIDDENAGLTSVDLKLNYLGPAISGKMIAKARQIKLGQTLGLADCQVHEGTGRLLAHGTLSVMVLPGGAPSAAPPFPPKFLK